VLSPLWEDECLAYDRQTGDTHVLAPLSREIASILMNRTASMSALELTTALHSDRQSSAPDVINASIESVLVEFVRLGFVDRTNG
jgi:PqqD family protein of HPr-rel-A system